MTKAKHCRVCGRSEDKVEFEKHRRICTECRHKQKIERVYEIREKYYSYLEACSCKHCRNKNPLVLQFHHKEDDKLMGISEMINRGYSWEKIKLEIDKCDVYCANCHSIITVAEADNTKLQRFSEYVPHRLIELAL